MAAWTSAKIVTPSGVVFLLEATSSAVTRAVYVGLLAVAHVGLEVHPGSAVLPYDRICGGSIFQL